MTDLLVDKYDHATVWTLNRPHRMNAMGGTLIAELAEAVREFEADPEQHVGVLTGAGEKAFCAGADLKEMADNASSGLPEDGIESWRTAHAVTPAIRDRPHAAGSPSDDLL
jgi:enoyl-CoA hydratase/carnithine racemase